MVVDETHHSNDFLFVRIASQDELPVGERILLEINGLPIVVFNLAGHLFAIGDVCTHDHGPLGDGEMDGYQIICPRHGARFDVRTGKVLALPAVENTPAYPVRVREGQIEIGILKSK
jgi:3-phenylpropionate/trans-cinnamate dioxygenase ferredoxin subunit